MGIFNFFKAKKATFDRYLDESISVDDRINLALTELDKRTLAFKTNSINFKTQYKILCNSYSELDSKTKNAKKEAEQLKKEGKSETEVKTKLMIYLSYKNTKEALEKQKEQYESKMKEIDMGLSTLESKRELLNAQAEMLKIRSSFEGLTSSGVNLNDLLDLEKVFKDIEAKVSSTEEVNELLTPKSTTQITNFSSEIDELYNNL